MIENLLSFTIATFFLAMAPGPDNIYVIAQSLTNGTKSGIATTVGLVTGCIVHTTLVAFGISAIITSSETLFYIIKIAGAVYLLFLAYKVMLSDGNVSLTQNAPKKSYFELFKQGLIMNLLNPKVMIFFLAFFPGFLWNQTENTISQFYILGILFMLVSFIVFSLLAILAGSVSTYLLKHKATGQVLKWLQVIVFVGIAIFILIP